MPTVGALLAGIVNESQWRSRSNAAITGVFDDSRRVTPGSIFVALQGTSADGRSFVADALARGAALVLAAPGGGAADSNVIEVAETRAVLARLAARWHGVAPGQPIGDRLRLLGVTGTNGKSTTAHMTREILNSAGVRCGMFGTVQYDLCSRAVAADMTTPGPLPLAAMVRECADAGAGAIVMEVSSHALDQKRADGLHFSAAAFTNLTQDHLDYHETMERYAGAKARLFALLDGNGLAIVNADDPAWRRMVRDCRARVLTYGLGKDADIRGSVTRDSINGTLYRMRIDGVELSLENAIVGRHNVYNAMAAAGLAHAAGAAPAAIERGLNAVRNVAGRLQRVPCLTDVDVFVDYAHTDDALRNVAGVLKPLTRGRLIIVFGCGGDRDRGKRPKMARAAAEFGDHILVTSDNPRTEDPNAIIREIVAGFGGVEPSHVTIEPDRRAAIFAAVREAAAGDVVLIAGKGHEDYQIVGKAKHHFDDVEIAIEAAAAARGGAVRSGT